MNSDDVTWSIFWVGMFLGAASSLLNSAIGSILEILFFSISFMCLLIGSGIIRNSKQSRGKK